MPSRRPEEGSRYKKLMKESIQEGGYSDEFRVEKGSRRDTQDLHIIVDEPVVREESSISQEISSTTPTSRRSAAELHQDNTAVYVALVGLLVIGSAFAFHGVGTGATTYILHAINHYGFTQEAWHAVSSVPAVEQLATGIGLDMVGLIGMKVTTELNRE